jgi:hypothetical protein
MTETMADDDDTREPSVPFITRVRLKNYKSIAECDVRLGPLTVLRDVVTGTPGDPGISPRGAGKPVIVDSSARSGVENYPPSSKSRPGAGGDGAGPSADGQRR